MPGIFVGCFTKCKLKTLVKWFDKLARYQRGNVDGIFVGLLFMSRTNKLKATHSALHKHLKPFKTLGCSGYFENGTIKTEQAMLGNIFSI